MFKSRIKSRYRKCKNSRLYQGDILKDLDFVFGDSGRRTEKDRVQLEYAVILSQDCDIEHDFKNRKEGSDDDKNLKSLLVCPAYPIDKFVLGTQITGWQMKKFNSKDIDKIRNNTEYKRYHYLYNYSDYLIPELVLDFKHFFTLPRDFLYKQRKQIYIASLSELFREELSQRFSSYLSRIGLPEFR